VLPGDFVLDALAAETPQALSAPLRDPDAGQIRTTQERCQSPDLGYLISIEARGGLAMPGYRVYQLDATGHIVDRAEINAAQDLAAIEASLKCFPSAPVEVWEGDRLVETSDPEQRAIAS